MSVPVIPFAEFDQEMANTRRLLERMPTEKAEWKPHPKSFAAGHLTQLVAWMPGWIATTLRETDLDLGAQTGYSFEPTEKLVATFDRNVAEARDALASVTDPDELQREWSLKHGGNVLFSAPRSTVVRMHLSHLIHHRAQLTVYARLLDVPVPPIYGPTADEKW